MVKALRALTLISLAGPLLAQAPAPAGNQKLEYVVYLSRHGVRSPLTANSSLNNLSVDPWPEWGDYPVGYMTAHGRWLMQLLGRYDREYLMSTGLMSGQGCEESTHFYFWADNAQRDIEGARTLAYSLFPECKVPIHQYRNGLADPLFAPATKPLAPGIQPYDRIYAAAALGGRLGDSNSALYAPYITDVEFLQRILMGCNATEPCPKNGRTPQRMLLDPVPQPAPSAAPRDRLADFTAHSGQMGTVAEAFYLEYVDGKDMKDVAWGRIDEKTIERFMAMRSAAINMNQRTPYIAKAHASNMLSHILRSMKQAIDGKPTAGSLGNSGDKALIILGHDGDIVPISAVLNLSYVAEGYPPNDTPPGSALIFEIWRDITGARSVRTYLITETPQKMRDAVPLTLATPPTKTAIFVPACSTIAEGYPCAWDTFRKLAEAAIDPNFVATGPMPAESVR